MDHLATLLFYNVIFQFIVPHCKPKDVVHLLNDLFTKFDRLVTIHDVYKVGIPYYLTVHLHTKPKFQVETVGDSYMTVGGIPDAIDNHCEKICHVALGMIWEGRSVVDPVNAQPLIVRAGIHSGMCHPFPLP